MSLAKWAVDSSAKEYWSNYYKEYGKSWVRDIPRRVKKAMVQSKKVASAQSADLGLVTPIGTAVTEQGVILEGMFRTHGNDKFIFSASFDHEGNIVDFDATKLVQAETV